MKATIQTTAYWYGECSNFGDGGPVNDVTTTAEEESLVGRK